MARGWIDLKAAVTGQNDAAIITECERGEQVAVRNYEEARKHELPSDVRTIVERQYQGAVQNLERVRTLGAAAGAEKPVVAPTFLIGVRSARSPVRDDSWHELGVLAGVIGRVGNLALSVAGGRSLHIPSRAVFPISLSTWTRYLRRD